MSRVDLIKVVEEVLVLMRNELQRRSVFVETFIAPDADAVRGDHVQIQQVVLNLFMNGVEALDAIKGKSRRLTLRSQQTRSGYIEITVSDTGIGLDPQAGDKVFQAFFTTKAEGIGMGLSICRSIVEAHGGRLWATPNRPSGSIFHFTVPGFESGQTPSEDR